MTGIPWMESNGFIAVLDTCVLAPMPVADTLLRLAEEPAFYLPRWSDDILSELRRTLGGPFRFEPAQVERRVERMSSAFPEAMVTGYGLLIEHLKCDPKDRHVLACAIRAGAHAIISDNKRHFPEEALEPFGIDCLTAGEFLLQQYHLNEDRMISILRSQAAKVNRSVSELLLRLPRELRTVIRI